MSSEGYIFDPKDWEIASTKKMINYSFGFVLSLYLVSAYNSLIFYFYEVEVGLSVELVSLAIILYIIWIMISSPIIGYLTDKPFKFSQKLGLRTPWIIISAIPALIFYFLLFLPPNIMAKSNSWSIFFYLLIISCLYGTFIMLFREHHEGGFANHYREDFERRRASAISFIFPGLILFFMSILPLFIIKYGDKSTFVLTALISVIIMVICFIFLLPGIKESKEMKNRYFQGFKNDTKIPFAKMLKISLKQKNFRTSLLAITLMNIAIALNYASGIYFFKDVLKLPLFFSIYPTIIFFITLMVFVPFWYTFARKHGNIRTLILGMFLSGLAYIPYLWITTLEEAMFFAILRGAASSCYTVMILPIVADCYDEVTLACGRHQEATLLGIRTISIRSAVIFQALIIGIIHIFTGYNSDPKAIQTSLAIWGIRIHRALIPMILCFLACLIMILWYDLKGEKLKILKAELRLKGL